MPPTPMQTQQRKAQLALLENTRFVSHSGRFFLQHLYGVYGILNAWGSPEAVCTAGLFHSVYGTQYFQKATFTKAQRAEIKCLIGDEAEALSYAFCHLDRRQFIDMLLTATSGNTPCDAVESDGISRLRITKRQLSQLLTIEMANLLEQLCAANKSPAVFLSRLVTMAQAGAQLSADHPVFGLNNLTHETEHQALFHYHQALAETDTLQATTHIHHALAILPSVGEVSILYSALALDQGDFQDALIYASEGAALLSRWASPWDKRFLLSDWLGLAERIQSLAFVSAGDVRLWPKLQQQLSGSNH